MGYPRRDRGASPVGRRAFLGSAYAQSGDEGKFIVVLDPGHGGKDPGTLGTRRTRIYEKHVVLAVAQKLRDMLQDSLSDVRVILTRDGDRYPSFKERVDAANKNRADLFVSIHCNAAASSAACGAETYVMATNKSAANLEISKTENAPMLMEENYREVYQRFRSRRSGVEHREEHRTVCQHEAQHRFRSLGAGGDEPHRRAERPRSQASRAVRDLCHDRSGRTGGVGFLVQPYRRVFLAFRTRTDPDGSFVVRCHS